MSSRPVHPDFLPILLLKEPELVERFTDLREFILGLHPEANEMLYHTHALTSCFSISEKLGDAFCMINIYTNHLNLGFPKGTLLDDPHGLLTGTGNLIRHIAVKSSRDYRSAEVTQLIITAFDFAVADTDAKSRANGKTISKIKK